MTLEIPKNDWKDYFDELSRTMAARATSIQVLSADVGAQILSDGLPFMGLTYIEEGAGAIDLTVGSSPDSHQTHNILAPAKVEFEEDKINKSATLEILDAAGAKTLVHFDHKIPVLMEYKKSEMIAFS